MKPEKGSEDDWSNDEELMKPSHKQPNKKKTNGQSKKLLASNDDSDDSDFGSTVAKQKVKKSVSAKPPAPKKAKVSKPKAVKKTKKHAFGESSDEGSGSDATFDLSNVGPARDRPGRAKTVSKYNFGGDSSDDDF